MKQEAADELVWLQCHGFPPLTMAIVAPFEGDGVIIPRYQAAVGDGDAMGIAGETGEDLFRPGEGAPGVNHPIGFARRAGMGSQSLAAVQRRQVVEELPLTGLVSGG